MRGSPGRTLLERGRALGSSLPWQSGEMAGSLFLSPAPSGNQRQLDTWACSLFGTGKKGDPALTSAPRMLTASPFNSFREMRPSQILRITPSPQTQKQGAPPTAGGLSRAGGDNQALPVSAIEGFLHEKGGFSGPLGCPARISARPAPPPATQLSCPPSCRSWLQGPFNRRQWARGQPWLSGEVHCQGKGGWPG